jgi:hypothetical protein
MGLQYKDYCTLIEIVAFGTGLAPHLLLKTDDMFCIKNKIVYKYNELLNEHNNLL